MTEIIKVELNGKNICQKPLNVSDTLKSIREKLKTKIGNAFFLDTDSNQIDIEDESNFTLKDILFDSKILKCKSGEESSDNEIKICLDGKNVTSKKCSKSEKLSNFRKLIENEIKDFLFLDEDGNEIDKEDEESFVIENIVKNEIINIKNLSNNSDNIIKKESSENNSSPKIKEDNRPRANINLSEFEEIDRKKDLILYKYPIKDKQTINVQNPDKNSEQKEIPLIFKYTCDEFDINDDKFAYVILFVGKTGHGKSTAINAFFNILKGIRLEDKYRLILIKEAKKEGGQAVSQTDGIHMYYIKDYNNKPVIIIDSQGYGDTRGMTKDLEIDEAFRFAFSNIINHINAIGFISNATINRIDIETKYIFASITKLFAGDITDNFIILATHANDESIEEGPMFVETIQTDAECLKIEEKKKRNIRWWFAFDSITILRNKITDLSKFSYNQLSDFYEEKVKKLEPKDIKQSSEVLNNRWELTKEINKLSDTFQDLLIEQKNLESKEKQIEVNTNEIIKLNKEISEIKEKIKNLKPEERERMLLELEKKVNQKISELSNQTEIITRKELQYYDGTTTHCNKCKRNCHYDCDCLGKFLFGRCTVFSQHFFSENTCDVCGCVKSEHGQDSYFYQIVEIRMQKDNKDEIESEKMKTDREKEIIEQKLQKEKREKEETDMTLQRLYLNKENLEKTKENLLKEKEKIKEQNQIITNRIQIIIINLQKANEKLELIAMNRKYMKTVDEYIDDLSKKVNEVYGSEEKERKKEQLEKMNEIKKKHDKIKDTLKLTQKDLDINDPNVIKEIGDILNK